MKTKQQALAVFLIFVTGLVAQPSAKVILDKVDANMSARNMITESSMTIYGKRRSQTITSKSYTVGDKKSFTEYLSPVREKGTKMLKLEDQLWIYSPSTDRTILISGHMLRQSVMGSDMSYEDMMDDRKLLDIYDGRLLGEEVIDGRRTYLLELIAIVENVAYYKRHVWIDVERYVPLKEELFAKSGQLMKKTTLSDVKNISGRWYPTSINYKDMMKQGDGTDFVVIKVQFDQEIPEYIFSKAALKM